MRATKVNAGLAESSGSLLLGIWRDSLHVTCGLTACTPGSAPGRTLGDKYGKTLPVFSNVALCRLQAVRASGRDAMGSDRLTTEDAGAVQFLGDDHGQDADRWSASNASVDVDQFFAIYFSPTRFTVETAIAMTSAGINAAVLATLVVGGRFWTHGHHGRTVYCCQLSPASTVSHHGRTVYGCQLSPASSVGHHGRTVYRCLFSNLAVADCLSSVSMWLGGDRALVFAGWRRLDVARQQRGVPVRRAAGPHERLPVHHLSVGGAQRKRLAVSFFLFASFV